MKINQVLNERISISQSVMSSLSQWLINLFQNYTTIERPYNGTMLSGPNAGPMGLLILEQLWDKANFQHFINSAISIAGLPIKKDIKVQYGTKNTYGQTALLISRIAGARYSLMIDHATMDILTEAYRGILGKLYRFEDQWIDLAESSELTPELSVQMIKDKNKAVKELLLQSPGFAEFCAVIVHELAHLATEQSAYNNYWEKNPEKYIDKINARKQKDPHIRSQENKRSRLSQGIDSHFANPSELDSYAQEIASRIRYAVEHSDTLPVYYIRRNLDKLVQRYRKEVARSQHGLNKEQQKYIYKLYKRVYQEIADILEGAKK